MALKRTVTVVEMKPDLDQLSGQQYTQVVFAIESPVPRPPPQIEQSMPIPIPRVMSWKHILHIFVPNSEWRGQYQMWQKYDITMDETTGEVKLESNKEGT